MRQILAAVLLTALSYPQMSHAAESRPNIVLLMGDDHGWEETGYHGHPHVKTPVLDELVIGEAASRARYEQRADVGERVTGAIGRQCRR